MIREDAIVEFSKERFDPEGSGELHAVYLFGSCATGSSRPDSDVDVAVLTARPIEPVERFKAAQDLASKLGRDVDLIDLTQASTVLRSQVVGEGRRIHAADPVAADTFEMYALSDYARLNEERREVLESFAARYRG